jgi:hypothetical protein
LATRTTGAVNKLSVAARQEKSTPYAVHGAVEAFAAGVLALDAARIRIGSADRALTFRGRCDWPGSEGKQGWTRN